MVNDRPEDDENPWLERPLLTSKAAGRGWKWGCFSIVILLAACGGWIFLDAVQTAREASSYSACLERVGPARKAWTQFATNEGTYPPSVFVGDAGVRASWRTKLLPSFGTRLDAEFRDYDFEEPWSSPQNTKLLDVRPWAYHCYSLKNEFGGYGSAPNDGRTGIVAVTPPGRNASEGMPVVAGESRLITIERVHDRPYWTEPRDLPPTYTFRLSPHDSARANDLGSSVHWGVPAAFVGGRAELLSYDIDPKVLEQMVRGRPADNEF